MADPGTTKRLIVNADDFGFTRDVNEGIVEAHRAGIVTATTMMANGAAFVHAAILAHETPSLDVGCHLVLVQGRSVLDPSREFPATIKDLVKALLRKEISVYEELRAQVRKTIEAGVRPSHLDTHRHTHLFPPVLNAVARIAREFRIPWVRRPFDFGVDNRAGILQGALALGLRAAAPVMRRALAGVRTTDHFAGFQITGSLDTSRLLDTLEHLPDGVTELMCHPGKLGEELQAAPTRLKQSREVELTALTSPEVRQFLEERGIELVSYRGLSCVSVQ